MNAKRKNYLVLEIGIVILGVSLAADYLGIDNQAGFGWEQSLGVVVGVVLAVLGFWLSRRQSTKSK